MKKTILPIVWAFSDSKTHKKVTFEKNVRVVYSNDKTLVFVVYTDRTTTPPVFDHVVLPNGKLIPLGTNDPKRKALSVNIEEYTDGLGLFLPTEPLLFGLMVLFLFIQIKSPFLDVRIWRNPIIICVLSYIIWLVFTSVTSTDPLISFKSVLANEQYIKTETLTNELIFKEIVEKGIEIAFDDVITKILIEKI